MKKYQKIQFIQSDVEKPIERDCKVVAVDFMTYEENKERVPEIDGLHFYEDRAIYADWMNNIEDIAKNMDLFLDINERDMSVGRLCGSMLWSAMINFIHHITSMCVYMESNRAHEYVIDKNIHPIMSAVFRDVIRHYDGRILNAEELPDIKTVNIRPNHSYINHNISKILNIIKPVKSTGGYLFYRSSPSKELVKYLIKKNVPIHIINPQKKLIIDPSICRYINAYFVCLLGGCGISNYSNHTVEINGINVTNSLGEIAKRLLGMYLASYKIMRNDISTWVKSINPSMAVVGEKESALSYVIYDAMKSINRPVFSVPHGLTATLKYQTIEGIENCDFIAAYTEEIKNYYERNKAIHKKIALVRGNHLSINVSKKSFNYKDNVLVLEYGMTESQPGENHKWYYEYPIRVIRSHFMRYPDRRIIFRFRPWIFKYSKYYASRRKYLWDILNSKNRLGTLKQVIFDGYIQLDYLNGGIYQCMQEKLFNYMNKNLPRNSFIIDNSPTFCEAISRVKYVIGGYSTCFLEAVFNKTPYYCYNPAKIEYPPPLDNGMNYVYSNIEDLLDSIEKNDFRDIHNMDILELREDAIMCDYERVKAAYM